MRHIRIVILSLWTFNATQAQGACDPPVWFSQDVREDPESLTSYAHAARLNEAITKAEDKIWKALYDRQDQGKLQPSDFYADTKVLPNQESLDKAIRNIYRWALTGRKKTRKYEIRCQEYFVAVKLDLATVESALRSRDFIKEYVFFILENHAHLVKEELNWQYFWRRHGLMVEDRSGLIKEGRKISVRLLKKPDLLDRQLAIYLEQKGKQLENLYLALYNTRKESLFLQARQQLVPLILKYGIAFKAASAADLGNYAEAASQLQRLSETGDTNSFFLVGLTALKAKGLAHSQELAFKWLYMAYQNSDTRAKPYLIEAYTKGQGTKPDYKEALRLIELDFASKDLEAYSQAGNLLLNGGPNLEADPIKALNYLSQAAQQANPANALGLAKIYLKGNKGVTKDLNKAQFWFEKAQQKGSKEASKYLKALAAQKISMSAKSTTKKPASPKKPKLKKPPQKIKK